MDCTFLSFFAAPMPQNHSKAPSWFDHRKGHLVRQCGEPEPADSAASTSLQNELYKSAFSLIPLVGNLFCLRNGSTLRSDGRSEHVSIFVDNLVIFFLVM